MAAGGGRGFSSASGALIALTACALAAGCERVEPAPAVGNDAIRIGVVLEPGQEAGGARRGIELGEMEAGRAAELIGRPFELAVVEAGSAAEARAAAERLARQGAFAIVGGAETGVCGALSEIADAHGLIYLNTGCRADSLRDTRRPGTFHVEASEGIYTRARIEEGGGDGSAAPTLWHAGLVRFGAAQLNERFERTFGVPADGEAWAHWMAVKILWESSTRIRSTDPSTLARHLLDENTAFDGHKGQSLVFSAEDHQLRQPLYLSRSIQGATVPVEVDPLAGESAGMSSDEWAALEGRPVPAGAYLVVSNEGSGDVTVVDLEEFRVVSRVRVGSRPRGIRVAPGGREVYVALSDDAPTVETDEDAVAVVDLSSARVTERYQAGSDPEVFDLSPDGTLLYASNEDAGTATITDLTSGQVIATLPVGIEPEGVAVSPDGRWVYVTAETSNTVSVIDTRMNDVVASFLVDVRPRAAAFSPTRPRAYVTNEISATVSVVDTDAHVVVATIELPDASATPVGVAVAPDGSHVYVANGHANSVSVIDATTDEVVADVPVGRRPWGIAVSADGGRLFTANGLTNDVSVVDAAALEVIATIPVGQRPWGVAITE